MARFVFRLEPVLRARGREEEGRKLAVAELERQRLELEAVLRAQQARLTEQTDSLREGLTGTLHAEQVRRHATAVRGTRRQAQRLVMELAAVHRRLEGARSELAEAMRRRLVIERLRERQLQAWRQRQQRAEGRQLDEVAATAMARRDDAT